MPSPHLLRAIFRHRCAECHRGALFPTGAFSFNRPFEMYDRCPLCNANYEPEPGFYYGAMFISYIFSGFILLAFTMVLHWVLGLSLTASFFWVIALVAVFFVWWFRFSRAFWLNLMVRFRPEKAELAEKQA